MALFQTLQIIVIGILIVWVIILYLRLRGATHAIDTLRTLIKNEKGVNCPYADANIGGFKNQKILDETATLLYTTKERIPSTVSVLLEKVKMYENEIKRLKERLVRARVINLNRKESFHGGYEFICSFLEDSNHEELIKICNHIIRKKDSVVFLVTGEEKVVFALGASKDIVGSGFNSAKIAEKLGKWMKGGGGGNPSLASGGGMKHIDEVLGHGREMIKRELREIAYKDKMN